MFNYCNGHGVCNGASSTCNCYEGYGAASDITLYRAPDCSSRTCPAGKAWADIPTSSTTAHALAECSSRGLCDRSSGTCKCFAGFGGDACQRMNCPNDCSGHGQCVSMSQMAEMSDAFPLNNNTYYEGFEGSTTWDENMIFGCVCDSSWPVGLGPGQTQKAEWFGADCSLRHCPSGDDPDTSTIETDCNGVIPVGGYTAGEVGNLCQVDCANRGTCDWSAGRCNCYSGYYGEACTHRDIYTNVLKGKHLQFGL